MSKVMRGRSKAGKKLLSIWLSPEEIETLDELALQNLRSRSSQAAWIILQALSAAATAADNKT